jgi:predicted amidohydrolase YtcJ
MRARAVCKASHAAVIFRAVRRCAPALLLAVLAATCRGAPAVEPATLVLRGGTLVTMDEARPAAQAIALRGGTIAAVGTNADIQPYVGPGTEVIELGGQLVTPGFIESHAHLLGIGQAQMQLDLMDVRDWSDIVAGVEAAAAKAAPGDWIVGRGWHQEKWTSRPEPHVEGFPVHDALSRVTPNHPVLLTHASGHATFVNARAMSLAGITAGTPNPSGGEILKDAAGRPTGLLRETASGLATRAYAGWLDARPPEVRAAALQRQIDLAIDEALSHGITSLHDAGSSFETVDRFREAAARGGLRLRLWVMIRESPASLAQRLPQYRAIGLHDRHLTVAAIKVTADGALGSRGAWLLEPYRDAPDTAGLNTTPMDRLRETAAIAMAHDVQLAVHAIGDRANREVLNVFEQAFAAHPERSDPRWRIEHAQHLSAADIPRFGRLGVVASMQVVHATSDAPYVIARLGPRRAAEGAYVWRKLRESGARIANGTDAPVERIDPMANFHATITRRTADGTVFFGDQVMSRADALRSMTLDGAWAAKEEAFKGSLTPGKLADLVVLSNDIMTVPEDEIRTTRVVATIVAGKVVYRAP